jgi:putative ABC transport system permease protein
MVSSLQRKLWRDLAQMKSQIFTIGLVIASATGGFVGCMSTYGSISAARDDYYRVARFADVFADVKRAPRSLAAQIGAIPGVADLDMSVHEITQLALPGTPEPLIAALVGVPSAGPSRLNTLHVRRGREIDPAGGNEALVDEGFARARGVNPGDQVSILLNGKREDFRIVGVGLSPEFIFAGVAGFMPDPKGFALLWVDEDRLAASFDMEEAFNHVSVKLAPRASENDVIRELDAILTRYGCGGAYGRAEQLSNRALAQEMNQQQVLGMVLPGVFLWVVGFLLHVTLSRQITTQREQIAALKALGYANQQIFLHYMQFIVVVVTIGVAMGIGVGAWFGHYMTGMYRTFFHFAAAPYRLDVWIVAVAAAACYLTAVLGATQAVVQAVSLAPAQAMHPPSPPRYRRMLIERLRVARWVPPAARMIIRNIERRPLRALLAVLGIGGAGALVVAGTFWWDSFNYMMDVQFGTIERGDVIVSFGQPVQVGARFETERWPGVLQSETARSVPVRLRAGQRSYRTAITAIAEHATMRRLVDTRLREVHVPDEGLMLSNLLAKRLDVRPGDRVTVELLEGNRAIREMTVSGVVKEFFGLTGYMSRPALNRLAGEGDAISAVRLRYDSAAEQRLYDWLKETPRVATVAVKHNMLASFRETSARNVLVFTTIITLFAAAVAVGVVYNNARVALAERAWELASLRVLGLTRGEVSVLLLGELAFELVLAVPVGLVLGWALAVFLAAMTHGETMTIPVVISGRTLAIAAFTMLGSGVLSALIVRRRIDQLDLIAVLKTRE